MEEQRTELLGALESKVIENNKNDFTADTEDDDANGYQRSENQRSTGTVNVKGGKSSLHLGASLQQTWKNTMTLGSGYTTTRFI